ncbi:MAG: hypothetical protein ACRD1K_08170 [Acidimicrobiales bacterium]
MDLPGARRRLADDIGISRSGWLNRRDDPEFWDRVQDVCGLYLSPPENAVVYSIDEKTSIQAKERRAPTTPAAPGRPPRQESSTSVTAPPA